MKLPEQKKKKKKKKKKRHTSLQKEFSKNQWKYYYLNLGAKFYISEPWEKKIVIGKVVKQPQNPAFG